MTITYFKISILYIIRTIILYIYYCIYYYSYLIVNVIRVNENRAE